MQIFLDTANLNEIREAHSLGVIDGVTTNPTLIAMAGKDLHHTLDRICSIVDGPVNAEAMSTDANAMVKEAKELAGISGNIVVKIPLGSEGLKAVKRLKEEGVKTTMTLCFSSSQAILAAKAGADYVAPFIGRLDDISHVGMDLVRTIREIYDVCQFPAKIIVASVRNPLHVVDAALAGADVVTLPFAVLEKMVKHPLTDIGLEKFMTDWKKVPKR